MNDFAPHGNDTGADVLDEFQRWNKRHRDQSPLKFLGDLLARWDIEPIDWRVTDEDAVKRLGKEQPVPLSVCDEAAIALAFAVIKLRGTCPAEVLEMAKGALDRTTILVNNSTSSGQVKSEWDAAVAKMRTALALPLA